ncbi:MAG: polyprenyl synthetase family protein [Flavobacteriales bacterium]
METAKEVKNIKAPVEEEMKLFEGKFRESLKSDTPLLNKVTHYIIKRKGKQMRPLFVFLSTKLCGEVNESSYTAASLIELLHTATLVHDDVVDDADERRGFFSLNALWKNKIAVLVGDYLLSRGLIASVQNNEYEVLNIVSNAVREMSEGELFQIEKSRSLNITEDEYLKVIRQKTASLIASCCEAGAVSAGTDEQTRERMRLFGEYTGMAFQIKDDLFDLDTEEDVGKPSGIDIKERKMTLPILYTLNCTDKKTRRKIINTIKNHNDNDKKVTEVIDIVVEKGGLAYAQDIMMEFREKALSILTEFQDTPPKDSLIDLVKYTTERKK